MLQQLRGLAQVAGGGSTNQAPAASAEGFAGELQRSHATPVNAVQDRAYGQAEAFELRARRRA